jgi:DNA-binding XRE family transcriptional regulator
MTQQPDHTTFRAVRQRLGYSIRGWADALGLSRSTVELYERGTRKDDDRPVEIPRTVWLAVAALAEGLQGVDASGRVLR